MIVFGFVKGLCFGIEYDEHEDIGFVINLDLGIFRVTWYRDLEEVE
jgi:hypothetical protein